MSTIRERLTSGTLSEDDSGDAGSLELVYDIDHNTDPADALTLLQATAPATVGDMSRQVTEVEPTEDDSRWVGRATYGLDPTDGDTTFNFDTGGGTSHITNSRSTISKTAAVGTAPDHKGAIGVTGINSVAGVDIVTPKFDFALTVFKDSVTTAYLGNVYDLTGKTNNAQVVLTINGATLTFEIGELLFRGASGGKTLGKGQWENTYRFTAIPNATNIPVGAITVPAKKGHEYLWVQYRPAEDGPSKTAGPVPFAAYVEQVYLSGNFALL